MRNHLRKWISKNRAEIGQSMKIGMCSSVQENIEYIQNKLFHSGDLKWRSISLNQVEGYIVYLESLTDQQRIQKEIIQPIEEKKVGIVEEIITSVEIGIKSDLSQLPTALVQGKGILLFEG
ncbi:hypothetical protein AC624_08475 [Bacillus sp. FJAT-27238]|nr:hypothetical protein AC624_08475 [Bacillus sp. FJAT-27238]